MNEKQKTTFLNSEGNAWFERNHTTISRRKYDETDPIIKALETCTKATDLTHSKTSFLEVGCGEARRLQWLADNRNVECSGVEPSSKAVDLAKGRGMAVTQGTADELPFADNSFEVVAFGFCLYLCDREDLFNIAKEADRVLKDDGWVIVWDFFSQSPIKRPYHHFSGLYSYKMDYKKLWDWHPDYTCISQEKRCHDTGEFCDDRDEWTELDIIRKNGLR